MCTYQVLPSGPFGDFKWPFQGLSDLHLGYQKVTWKKLVQNYVFFLNPIFAVRPIECEPTVRRKQLTKKHKTWSFLAESHEP